METSRFKTRRATVLVTIIVALVATSAAFAEPDEDELFGSRDDSGGDPLISEASETDIAIAEQLLTEEDTVRLGGSFGFTTGVRWTWDGTTPAEPQDVREALRVDLQSRLKLNARPSTTTRLYAEVWLTYPFDASDDDRSFDDVFYVDELFSDFTIGDRVFLRAGKQTMNWGVGRFFSPADLMNLSRIDPENPDEDLEGPVAVRANMPLGTDNAYAYLVVPDGATAANDLAAAAKYELVAGRFELTAGGYYEHERAPVVMGTATTTLGDVSFFLEATASYGSDKTFVVEEGTGVTTATHSDGVFPHASAGATYRWSSLEGHLSALVTGQYYFNGEGYADPDLISRDRVAPLLASGELSARDLDEPGRHYAAASAMLSARDDASVSVLAIANMSDLSGVVTPKVSVGVGDSLSVNVALPYSWGEAGSQYAPSGSRVGVSVDVTMGTMSF